MLQRPLSCVSTKQFSVFEEVFHITCSHPAPHYNMRHSFTLRTNEDSFVTFSWPTTRKEKKSWESEMEALSALEKK